jgi:OOP family OmpA-OmpF porin
MRFAQLVARWFLGLGFALAVASTPARAADDPDGDADRPREFRFEMGLYAGWRNAAENSGLGRGMNDGTGLSPASAPLAGARLTLNFNRWFAMEAELDASKSHTRNDAADLGLYGYRGSLLLNLVGSGPVRPFVLAGYGATTLVSSDERVVANDTDGAFHAGGGIKLVFGDRVGLRFEGRAYIPPTFAKDVIPTGEGAFGDPDWAVLGTLYFTVSEIISERYYHREVEKVVVVPPPAPPPAPSDPDHDGLAGSADACPVEPEDLDGFQDHDGCPDPDNDGDGIADAQDKCPNNAETRNGVDDDDGCPEEDTDGDGFIGSRDKCPDAPETKNNYQDDDGCPDEIPAAVKKFTGVIEGINFSTNSADILPGSYAILERAVAVLTEFPDVKLEISGHTDNVGRAAHNRDLSQRRAEAVRQFLVMRGIKPDRLVAIGFGSERPIADNTTRSGRATNRRTEFKLIGN